MTSEDKFLFVLVRDVLHRRSGDQIDTKYQGNKHTPALRSFGYLKDMELTQKAFQRFFDTFGLVSCPNEIQQLANSLGVDVFWRRAHGVIEEQLDRAGDGSSFRNMRTVFVRDEAKLETWYHEFGHILYGCIKNNPEILILFQSLQQEATSTYPVVSQEEMTPVQHHLTNEPVSPLPGRYVLINGRYHGLDHSGDDAEGESDELWASLFEEYQSGRELTIRVRTLVETIIDAIRALPKPLDLCDKD
jgi:hypothetical protein